MGFYPARRCGGQKIKGIAKYIRNAFDENEEDEKSNVQFLHIANVDYNLDVIIKKAGTNFNL